jgi:hypothetical protein
MHRPLSRLRVLIAALMAAGLALGLTFGTGGTAKAATNPGYESTTPCFTGSGVYCSFPYVSTVGPASRCGTTDYYGTRDASGIAMAWTYQIGGTAPCTTVVYDPQATPPSSRCNIWFYDPNGDATADFFLEADLNGGRGTISYAVAEGPHHGWIPVGVASNLDGQFFFADNAGATSKQIGWGTNLHYGIWLAC